MKVANHIWLQPFQMAKPYTILAKQKVSDLLVFGKTIQRNVNLAKIYDASSKWLLNGLLLIGAIHTAVVSEDTTSSYDEKEETEWMKPGSGDGFLVWDKNGNGIIDDNTEMMSEFDENGNKRFQNGFEKLAFYFDLDNSGVVKGEELKKLKFGLTSMVMPKQTKVNWFHSPSTVSLKSSSQDTTRWTLPPRHKPWSSSM